MRLLRIGITLIFIGAALLGVSPAFADPGGTGPQDAVELVGVQSGSLAAGREFWYRIWDNGTSLPLGVVLNFAPVTIETNPYVTFKVWVYERRTLGAELVQIGQGTVSSQPIGVKYWRGGSGVARTYYLQVVNGAPDPVIYYAMAFTGATYNPPGLPVPVGVAPAAPAETPSPTPAAQPPVVAPSPAPVTPAVPPAVAPSPTPETPVVPTAPSPSPTPGGGTSLETAVPIEGIMSGRVAAQRAWYKFYYSGDGNPMGLVMNFVPPTIEDAKNDNFVSFRVWTLICKKGPDVGMDPCKYQDVGGGTRSSQPIGVKYWRHSGPEGRWFYIEIFNNSGQPSGYALALTGDTYPPRGLPVPAP